jgi:hypothetical protein
MAVNDWFEQLFGFKELTGSPEAFAATKAAFRYDLSTGQLTTNEGVSFAAGTFSTPTLAELRAAGIAVIAKGGGGGGGSGGGGGGGGFTFGHIATQGVLQMHAEHPGATFLAASGLNCLEFTGPGQRPEDGVTRYERDNTQGPACALACAPGTVVRNYFSANGPTGQLSLLDNVWGALGGARGAPFAVRSGYVSAPRGAAGLAEANAALAKGTPSRDALRDAARVGVQARTEVVFAAKGISPKPWARAPQPPPHVTQVYAAALSLGGYKDPAEVPDEAWAPLATLVLESAYEGALWAAVAAAAAPGGSREVFLTGLGQGVFGNKAHWIADAIGRAVGRLREAGARLDVRFVHYRAVNPEMRDMLDASVKEKARAESKGAYVFGWAPLSVAIIVRSLVRQVALLAPQQLVHERVFLRLWRAHSPQPFLRPPLPSSVPVC